MLEGGAPRRGKTHVHDVQLRQEAAVCQGQLVTIKEPALGECKLGVPNQLILQGGHQVLVQLAQGFEEVLLQGWEKAGLL